jgi:hypothetical protein
VPAIDHKPLAGESQWHKDIIPVLCVSGGTQIIEDQRNHTVINMIAAMIKMGAEEDEIIRILLYKQYSRCSRREGSSRKLESPIQAGSRDQTIYSDRPIARDSRIDYSL